MPDSSSDVIREIVDSLSQNPAVKLDSPEVTAIIAQLKTQFPEREKEIDLLLMVAKAKKTGQKPDAAGLKSILGYGGGSLSLGAIALAAYYYWPDIQTLLNNPDQTNMLLLGVTILGGLVGGLVNAYLAGNLRFLPGVLQVGNTSSIRESFKIFYPGLLGNLVTAVAGAVVSVWLPLYSSDGKVAAAPPVTAEFKPEAKPAPLNEVKKPASDANAVAVTNPKPPLASTFVGSLLVGLFGARVLTSQRDSNLLVASLQKAVSDPKNDALSEEIKNAKTIQEKTALVLGAAAAPAASPDPKAVEAELLAMIDKDTLSKKLKEAGPAGQPQVLRRDGAPLEVGMLTALRSLNIPESVKSKSVMSVADQSQSVIRGIFKFFLGEAADVPKAADATFAAAVAVKNTLAKLPADWKLEV